MTSILLDGDDDGNKLMAVVEGGQVTFQITMIEDIPQGGKRIKTRHHFTLPKGTILALADVLQMKGDG